ncbi:unnamed protein product [Rangifer tarandus platyrhynchus]|uniref:Uncharacterized protein n=1 Tax=Rangifer tarandus platyrhynchus TaxID=3082113 RepID=A0ABN8Z3D7_RANTA|nr:unnamed protein product [Rangifer tarandus platyrhynchus]
MEQGGSQAGCGGRREPETERAQRPEAPGTRARARRPRRALRRGRPQRRPAELQESGAGLGPAARCTPFLPARPPELEGSRSRPGWREGSCWLAVLARKGGGGAGRAAGGPRGQEPAGRAGRPGGTGRPCAKRAGRPGLRAAAGAGAAASRAERAVQPSALRLPEENPAAPALG